MEVYVHATICKLLWCSGIAYISCALEKGVRSICHRLWFSRDLCLIEEGGGLILPWVYVHSAIYETYLV